MLAKLLPICSTEAGGNCLGLATGHADAPCTHTCKLPASQYWRTIQVSAMLPPVAESVLPRSWETRVTDPVRRAVRPMSDDTFATLSPAQGRAGVQSGYWSLFRQEIWVPRSHTDWLAALCQAWRGGEKQAQTNCLLRWTCSLPVPPPAKYAAVTREQLPPVNRAVRPEPKVLKLVICSAWKPSGVALCLPTSLSCRQQRLREHAEAL